MTSSDLQLREATIADSNAIASLLAELGHPVASADVPARLASVANDNGTTLVAVDANDVPVGLICITRFAALHSAGPVAYIIALVTAHHARRRGVGKLLVSAAKAWAARHHCVRLTVTSAERRADAHAFYPSCGLPYTGRRFATSIS